DPASPAISPAMGNLEGLPPAYFIVGTLDPLLDDSIDYARMLVAAEVRTTLSIHPYQPHVFLQLSALLDGGRRGVAEASQALQAALA
ncbi:MAG: alpha/beta hydrolase fold domain-containing protein, partial [Dehalococcoidia bacterium]